MTRPNRASRLPYVCLLIALFPLSPLAALPAHAGVLDFLTGPPKPPDTTADISAGNTGEPAQNVPAVATPEIDSESTSDASLGEMDVPAMPGDDQTGLDGLPIVEKATKRMSCVPFARERSGLQIFGDAKYWWNRAKDIYARVAQPVSDAVMVFSGSSRIRRGHVAVVTAVISPREIKVDHANWQNRGEIDLNMPVLDVSRNNDWSQVRVWDPRTGQFGARVYAISGFIMRKPPTTRGS